MSGYDENPFADPEATNPFADPSVQQNTWNQPTRGGGLDDFNPFENNAQTTTTTKSVPPSVPPPVDAKATIHTGQGQPSAAPSSQPAVMQATQEMPSSYSSTSSAQAQAQAATDDLKRRQDELERKAAELQRKEQELQRNLGNQVRANNFPPLPDKCCVKPCFFQDFELDIPLEFQKLVKTMYYIWISYGALLLVNVIGCGAHLAVQSSSSNVGTSFGLSILYLFLFTPCSFVCWYRPIYKAFRSDSSFNFFFFFFVFFMQFCVCVLQAIGINGWGTAGILSAIQAVSVNKGVGTFMFIIAAFFVVCAVLDFIMLIKVHRIYRSTGASFAKAQAEFSSGVMSNKNVQKAAAQAGTAAMQGAMSSSADNRY